ncbi:putative uncharacterized protein DDB_G0271606 [Armigeres subalbatus]|uniref:putative uncharacterized protein DDB_G0271606 n=1 Tax=Armigeres subalbatus TaxID=124917 RepID=UPI002ED11D9E
MVQCDECDVWYHYDCGSVDDSVGNRDWSCNGCVRTVLEKQRYALSEQLEHLDQQQRKWQREQQEHLRQLEERQKLEQQQEQPEWQQRKQEQFDQLQIGQLQLQQPSEREGVATMELEAPPRYLGAVSKHQEQRHIQVVDKTVPEGFVTNERRNVDLLASSTANNARPLDKLVKASSKASIRSLKLRDLQAKALEARQELERKQLEERLALDREMLEISDSEEESITSIAKINEWLDKTKNIGREARYSSDDIPLPVYDELLRKAIVSSSRFSLSSSHSNLLRATIGQPTLLTSTPRQNLISAQQQNQQPRCNDPVPSNSGHLAARQTVKDLPKFGGDPEDWPRFIAAYERTTKMCAFRNDELLDRLERSLQD